MSKIGVVLFRSDLTHHTSVKYLLRRLVNNIFKFYDLKGVCALNLLLFCPTCAATDTLTKPAKFIVI